MPKKGTWENDQLILELERRLSGLSPVEPNPGFITSLRSRLSSPEHVMLERQPRIGEAVLAVALGLTGGILLYWLYRHFWRSPE